jgi:hypothetical protein
MNTPQHTSNQLDINALLHYHTIPYHSAFPHSNNFNPYIVHISPLITLAVLALDTPNIVLYMRNKLDISMLKASINHSLT